MIKFELEIGGVIQINSMDAEEPGKVIMSGLFRFVKAEIENSRGIHGCMAIQSVKGIGATCIPNDMRHVLESNGIGFKETKQKGFTETEVQPIPADELR